MTFISLRIWYKCHDFGFSRIPRPYNFTFAQRHQSRSFIPGPFLSIILILTPLRRTLLPTAKREPPVFWQHVTRHGCNHHCLLPALVQNLIIVQPCPLLILTSVEVLMLIQYSLPPIRFVVRFPMVIDVGMLPIRTVASIMVLMSPCMSPTQVTV
jgi:hypothetical protein